MDAIDSFQNEAPATLAIGTQVSAKYKGAFCEAKVRSVVKQVKCRVTFSAGLGITTLSDEYIQCSGPLSVGANVQAKHPDKQEYLEAVINKIQDQSQYTVVFDDGDNTTLRRNALCMKSGKHYNASESLDNLPLTHPEHFSTPVSGSRRKKLGRGGPIDSDEDGSSSESEDQVIPSSYLANIGRVVWAENTDKKSKAKESWFPALIVAPSASGQGKIDTKEEFLIRSFKDGRYYTVSKKDTQKFHRDSPKKNDVPSLKEAIEKAITYITKEDLPTLWDKEVLFNMGEESTTESSETESMEDDEDEDDPQEVKDQLVANLYKHMEDRGSPINRTPTIGNKELDLYRLFKVVFKLGGHTRVTNNNLWRQVATKLGFETTWCTNQVRVHYKRYLQSFEELNKTLGCTMLNRTSKSGSSTRVQIRGKHRSGGSKSESNPENESDKSSIGSQDELCSTPKETIKEVVTVVKTEVTVTEKTEKRPAGKTPVKEPKATTPVGMSKKEAKAATPVGKSKQEPKASTPTGATKKEAKASTPTGGASKKEVKAPTPTVVVKKEEKEKVVKTSSAEETKMATRPRRDSTSSLAQAMQAKAQKDNIGDESRRAVVRMDRDKETECELRKLQEGGKPESPEPTQPREAFIPVPEVDDIVPSLPNPPGPPPRGDSRKAMEIHDDSKSDTSSTSTTTSKTTPKGGRKKLIKKKLPPPEKTDEPAPPVDEEKQDLADHVNVEVGDKIKVYYRHNQVYEAKVIKMRDPKGGERWPKFLVHYQGWNARYDEWIKRSKIAENLSWTKDRLKAGHKPATNPLPLPKVPGLKSDEAPKTPATTTSSSTTSTPTGKAPTGRGTRKSGTTATPTKIESRSSTPSRTGSRTGSPALKRQSSRSSIKKESEESEDEGETSSERGRKSRRLTASTPDGRRSGRKRPASAARELQESENDEMIDVEKDAADLSAMVASPAKAKRACKKPATPKGHDESDEKSSDSGCGRPSRSRERATTRQQVASKAKVTKAVKSEDDEDHEEEQEEETSDAFKEPVPLDDGATSTPLPRATSPSPKQAPMSTSSPPVVKKSAEPKESQKKPPTASVSTRSKRESDSTDSDESAKKARIEDLKEEPTENNAIKDEREIETCKIEAEPSASSDEAGKPFLQFNKTQQELFPFLSAIRTTPISPGNPTPRPPIEDTPPVEEVVVETIEAVVEEPSQPPPVPEVEPPSVVETTPTRKAVPKKRKTPRKPNSSELVASESESDLNSEDEKPHQQPPPRAPSSVSSSSPPPAPSAPEPEPRKGKKDEPEDLDLACGEVIPGSPVHPSSTVEVPETASPPPKAPLPRLEMPFASVPESIPGEAVPPPPPSTDSEDKPVPAKDDQPIMESSSASQSPSQTQMPQDGSKSPAESSEVDMDSLSGRKAESEDSRQDMEVGSVTSETAGSRRGSKRLPPSSPAAHHSVKRKRKIRETTSLRGCRTGRGRRGLGSLRVGHDEETDESEEPTDPAALSTLSTLDDDSLAALTQRPPKSSKYNFFVELTSDMPSTDRINKIQDSIDQLRKTYLTVKNDLAQVERKRKKMKRKEREKAEKASNPAASSSSSHVGGQVVDVQA
eukprot:snap_masked-scaffold214_size254108-processed-gene-0.9 protein:Tk01533 transcript:snap_masked-scaffold214_size254108-processed-gene-0.9-mRNA-1 annotation:"at-rich interactive domain-containing protein 4b"